MSGHWIPTLDEYAAALDARPGDVLPLVPDDVTPCLRCGELVPRPARGVKRWCAPCLAERRTEQARERMREKRALRREILADADTWRASWQPSTDPAPLSDDDGSALVPWAVPFDRWVSTLDLDEDDPVPLVVDRPLQGAGTPAGPDVGCSTSDCSKWQRCEYCRRAANIARHPDWSANSHWSHRLGEPADVAFADLAPGVRRDRTIDAA